MHWKSGTEQPQARIEGNLEIYHIPLFFALPALQLNLEKLRKYFVREKRKCDALARCSKISLSPDNASQSKLVL
jgi:hypothetical protein